MYGFVKVFSPLLLACLAVSANASEIETTGVLTDEIMVDDFCIDQVTGEDLCFVDDGAMLLEEEEGDLGGWFDDDDDDHDDAYGPHDSRGASQG